MPLSRSITAGPLLLSALLCALPGCRQLLPENAGTTVSAASAESDHEGLGSSANNETQASDVQAAAAKLARKSVTATLSEAAQSVLTSDAWIETTDGTSWHWRHPGMEGLLAESDAIDSLLIALRDPRAVVRGNAAIALARLGSEAALEPLVEVVESRPLKLSMRRAALETLGKCSPPEGREQAKRVAQSLASLTIDQANYVAELHADALAVLVGASEASEHGQLLLAAFESPVAEVRLAAVRACARLERAEIPARVVELHTDPDSRVRAAVLVPIARRTNEHALTLLEQSQLDPDFEVRRAAVSALGEVSGEQARQRLKKQLQSESEHLRSAAYEALATAGEPGAIEAAIADPNWVVRTAAVRMLSRSPSEAQVALACQLADDRSTEVQKALVQSLEEWPLSLAAEVLLVVCERGARSSQTAAQKQLVRRWPPAQEFTAQLHGPERAAALVELRQLWAERSQRRQRQGGH